MRTQNFKNHSQLVPIYHFVTLPVLLAILIGAIMNVINSEDANLYSATLILAISIVLILIFFFARGFALKAQDRAIRAEENFRHYILTGTPLSTGLDIKQVVALRFASDAEFPALAKTALAEGLSNKEIKKAIQNWRADHNRV